MYREVTILKLILGFLTIAASALFAQSQITIYNKNFATIKERRTLTLKQGLNELRVTDVTGQLEPDSVVLRSLGPATSTIRILEQNYERDPLSEASLLRAAEGKVIEFEVAASQTGEKRIIKARVLRSTPALLQPRFAGNYPPPAQVVVELVENGNKVQFGMPGTPLFDSLGTSGFLKPTLVWKLDSDRAGNVETEFSYMTAGLRWEATYNVIAPEKGDSFNVVGWVTIDNQSGKTFEDASVKLMAGDVARIQPQSESLGGFSMSGDSNGYREAARVIERTFDEYHLYTLPNPTTVRDREVKQVEFIRAANVPAKRVYIYDGFKPEPNAQNNDYMVRQPGYGSKSNSKVWTMLEFKNSKTSNLGMPLPAGKVKVYRLDIDGRNEFIGEDRIDHTAKDESARVYLGNAFDIAGERRQVSFQLLNQNSATEEFEIKIRNHKAQPVEVRVVEHLYRGVNWKIIEKSADYAQTDSRTIEFRPTIQAAGEVIIRYKIAYSW